MLLRLISEDIADFAEVAAHSDFHASIGFEVTIYFPALFQRRLRSNHFQALHEYALAIEGNNRSAIHRGILAPLLATSSASLT